MIHIKASKYQSLLRYSLREVIALLPSLNHCTRLHDVKFLQEANHLGLARCKVLIVVSGDLHGVIRPGQRKGRGAISPYNDLGTLSQFYMYKPFFSALVMIGVGFEQGFSQKGTLSMPFWKKV